VIGLLEGMTLLSLGVANVLVGWKYLVRLNDGAWRARADRRGLSGALNRARESMMGVESSINPYSPRWTAFFYRWVASGLLVGFGIRLVMTA
jgi:hypothetical protein